MKTEKVTITLPKSLVVWLKKMAKEQERSLSNMVSVLLKKLQNKE